MSREAQKALIPGSYKIESALLTNYAGEEIDIRALISEIKVTESIYSMFCIFDFIIIDGVSLLEQFAITGNEKIDLQISKVDAPGGPDVFLRKRLTLTGIKEYARMTNESQAYIVQAVSETALKSSAERVSKAVNGRMSNIIKTLYDEFQFELPLTVEGSETEGNYNIVLPNYTYTNTFAMLLNKAQNTNGDTFHLFEKLWGDMTLTNYTQIIEQEPVDTYYLLSGQTGDAQTPSSFDQTRTKIKSIESNLGVSHFEGFRTGGFNTRVFYNDIATKTFTSDDYSILDSDGGSRLEKDNILDPGYTLGGTPIKDFKQSKTTMINKNTMAYGEQDNLSNKQDEAWATRNFVYQNQFAVSHNVAIVGDSRLQAGKTINLQLPIATDPRYMSDTTDVYMSGKYFISTIQHTFNIGGSYTVDLTVRKDSIDREKMTRKYKSTV